MKFSTSLIAFAFPALSCSKSIQDAPVGSVDVVVDSLTDFVSDVVVDSHQRKDRRLQATSSPSAAPMTMPTSSPSLSNSPSTSSFPSTVAQKKCFLEDIEGVFDTFSDGRCYRLTLHGPNGGQLEQGVDDETVSNCDEFLSEYLIGTSTTNAGSSNQLTLSDGDTRDCTSARYAEVVLIRDTNLESVTFTASEPSLCVYRVEIRHPSCGGITVPSPSPSDAPTNSPAPTRDMFDWGISAKNDDVVVFSDKTMQREVVLKYFLSNKVYNVTIKAKNCSGIVPSNVISYVTTDDVLGSKNNATVLIDINQSSVENSVVWSTPEDDLFLIDFCVRLDLWYGDISMNFLEREVSLKVNMTSQNFTLSAANLDTTEGEEVNENVEAAYEVIACQCTDDGSCVTSQEDTSSLLSQGSSLYVCLRANTTDVIVDSVKELTIAQGGTLNAQVPIINGVNQGAVASEKLADMQNEFLVRTQLISAYFEDDTNDLTVSGVAKLAFKSGRKLSAKIVDVRNLQAQDQDDLSSQFGLNVNIQSGSNEDDLFSGGNVVDFIFPFASVVIMGIVLPAISALVM